MAGVDTELNLFHLESSNKSYTYSVVKPHGHKLCVVLLKTLFMRHNVNSHSDRMND